MQLNELAKFNLPDVPGVYLFKKGKKVLYVGKATSLRDRVRSYFDDDLIAARGPRVVDMVTKVDTIAHETTPTAPTRASIWRNISACATRSNRRV